MTSNDFSTSYKNHLEIFAQMVTLYFMCNIWQFPVNRIFAFIVTYLYSNPYHSIIASLSTPGQLQKWNAENQQHHSKEEEVYQE